jgi:hypothetical protein
MKMVAPLIVLTAMLLGLPLLGAALAGKPVYLYLEFPPVTRYVQHAEFSWLAFLVLGLLSLLLLTVLALMYLPPRPHGRHFSQDARGRFPWWGWVAVVLLLASWILAWTRFAWFRSLQPYTFTPLWLSYIAVINALTYRRVGACMITHRRQYLLALFPLSALFWRYFEYLNRFVQNWYYVGPETPSPLTYTVHATLAFSTVLPAVTSTIDLLSTYAALNHTRLRKRLVARHARTYAGFVLSLAALGLAGIAVWPDYLYPLLWVAPLCVLVSLQILLGQETVLSKLAQGHWHMVALSAMAALVCGFFWEMWNYYSYAKWVYAIPHVQRFLVFEMPVLGYVGYLPFGIECWVVADLVARRMPSQSGYDRFGLNGRGDR